MREDDLPDLVGPCSEAASAREQKSTCGGIAVSIYEGIPRRITFRRHAINVGS